MKIKLTALLTVPFLTIGLHAEDKPAAPAPPAPAAESEKKDDSKAKQEQAFKKADANSDANLTLEEFKALPRFKKDNSKAEGIFQRKDTNADSRLSLEEFTAKPAGQGKKGKGGKGGKGGEHPKKEEAKKA